MISHQIQKHLSCDLFEVVPVDQIMLLFKSISELHFTIFSGSLFIMYYVI